MKLTREYKFLHKQLNTWEILLYNIYTIQAQTLKNIRSNNHLSRGKNLNRLNSTYLHFNVVITTNGISTKVPIRLNIANANIKILTPLSKIFLYFIIIQISVTFEIVEITNKKIK